MAEGDYKKNYFTPRNIFIYLVIGAVLYGAVYFLFLSKKGGSPYQMPAATETSQEGNDQKVMNVVLSEQNSSGQPGTVTLTEVDGKTLVSIKLDTPSGVPQPAHIHAGACPTPGTVIYPLTNVVDGLSETVLEVDLATIRSEFPLAVNVHKSETEASVYVSCGDLK